MVDTLHIWRPVKVEKFDLSNVEDLTESVKPLTGETYFTGRLNNLRLSISDRGVSIKGSFPKFLKGNNIETLTAKEFQTVIEALQNVFNVSLSDAIINRIDLAATLQMEFAPAAYYQYLGNCERMFRSIHGGTLYYCLKRRQFVFYDKGKEIGKEFKGQNLLRFEVQYLKRIAAQFNGLKLRVEHLMNPDFYDSLKDKWKAEFKKIHKVEPFIKNPENVSTPKDFWNEFERENIKEKGFDKVEKEIMRFKHMGMNPRSISRLRKQLRDKTTGNSPGNSLINELESKVFSY